MDAKLLGIQERPYHVDCTTSRPLCEVKRRRARLVLRWGTTWEALVLFLFTFAHLRPTDLCIFYLIHDSSSTPTTTYLRLANIYLIERARESLSFFCPALPALLAYERTPTIATTTHHQGTTYNNTYLPAYTKQPLHVPGTHNILHTAGYPLGDNDLEKNGYVFRFCFLKE